MLKYGNFVLQPCLVKLFNIILSSGIYPTEWVQGLIFPIYKTGDPLNPSNYRGIAITSCLSKLFNSILNARLEKYILKNELIRNEQIGFKAGCRTSDHIFKLKTIIDKYLNKSKKVYACFIDLRKAFDSVIHSSLFLKPLRVKIRGKYLALLKSLYSNLSLRVIVNSHSLSNAFPSNVGFFKVITFALISLIFISMG